MINTLFYFVDYEAEYLAHKQDVAPYTIVFCKDTNTIWKDGKKYGGGNIDDAIEYVKKAEVDSALSPTSEMPVQNKVIYDKLMDYYTKQESDTKYQPNGNYQPAGNYATE